MLSYIYHLNCKLIQTRDFYNPIAQEEQPQAALHFGAVHKHKLCAYPCLCNNSEYDAQGSFTTHFSCEKLQLNMLCYNYSKRNF